MRYVVIRVEESDSREGCDSYCDWEDCAFQEPEDIVRVASGPWDQLLPDEPKSGPLWTMWLHFVGATVASVGEQDAGIDTHELEAIMFVMSGTKASHVAWLKETAE